MEHNQPNPKGFRPSFQSLNSLRRQAATLLCLSIPAIASAQLDTLMTVRDTASNLRMSLFRNGAFYVGGAYDEGTSSGGIPIEGAGTRMMWYPEKAAFRAGNVTAGNFMVWDDDNIGYHSVAMGNDVRASASEATAFGLRCVAAQQSSFAVGEQNVASGAASVAMGYHAHTNARQGSFVFSDRSSIDTLRAGVNHSSNWRVSGGFRIFTSSNLSTGVTIQSGASVSNWGQASAVISTSTGAMLTTGGVWTNSSDVNRKHLFEDISGEDILSRVSKLPITRWSYRNESDDIRHIGPMAQDFYASFGLGNDNRSIGTVDADGIALASIKALEARTTKMAQQLEKLEAENAVLRDRLDVTQKKSPISLSGSPMIAIVTALSLIGFLLSRRRGTTQAKG